MFFFYQFSMIRSLWFLGQQWLSHEAQVASGKALFGAALSFKLPATNFTALLHRCSVFHVYSSVSVELEDASKCYGSISSLLDSLGFKTFDKVYYKFQVDLVLCVKNPINGSDRKKAVLIYGHSVLNGLSDVKLFLYISTIYGLPRGFLKLPPKILRLFFIIRLGKLSKNMLIS